MNSTGDSHYGMSVPYTPPTAAPSPVVATPPGATPPVAVPAPVAKVIPAIATPAATVVPANASNNGGASVVQAIALNWLGPNQAKVGDKIRD